jgi:xanthine dehydrogenase iron-sulfur cluster and FAD-binding subunit A
MTNSHLLVQEFEYVAPATLAEALALRAEHGQRARLIAAGTYLLVQMKQEHAAPELIVDISRVPDLKGVALRAGSLQIGALTTIRDTRDLPLVQSRYQALAEACDAFGSMQIQMTGTLGGNVCNGSPASDAVPALLAFDAQLVLVSAQGERTVPLAEFLLGPGRVALGEGELLAHLLLPEPVPGTGSAFIKLSRVAADLAKVSGAAVVVRDGERMVDCKLALGSVAPTVFRAKETEAFLRGKAFNPDLAWAAAELAMTEVAPIDDVRSSAWYRREVTRAVTYDLLVAAWDRAGQERPLPQEPVVGSLPSAVQEGAGLRARAGERVPVALVVNGEPRRVLVAPNDLLLNVLREDLEFTGPKYGCGIGECGACTVLLNGRPALSCLTLAVAADGAEVLTVEGLQGRDGTLHPLQEAFLDHQAFQCGYCTPGILMMSKALLDDIPAPEEDDVREYLRGNRCRCTGFASIVRAVLASVGSQE